MTDDTLRIASAALGVPRVRPAAARRLHRSEVLRCRVPAGSVVVKKYPDGSSASFAREVAGLTALDHTPDLLAVDREHGLVVMSDLGTGPTLADLLLGDDREAAWAGALEWVEALADTLGRSRSTTFDAALGDLVGRRAVGGRPGRCPHASRRRPGPPGRPRARRRARPDRDPRPSRPRLGRRLPHRHVPGQRHPHGGRLALRRPGGRDRAPRRLRRGLRGDAVLHLLVRLRPAAGLHRPAARPVHGNAGHPPAGPRARAGVDPVGRPGVGGLDPRDDRLAPVRRRRGPPASRPARACRRRRYRQLLTTRWRWGAVRLRSTLPAVAGLLGTAAAWADDEWGASAAPVGPYRAFADDE